VHLENGIVPRIARVQPQSNTVAVTSAQPPIGNLDIGVIVSPAGPAGCQARVAARDAERTINSHRIDAS
jgi:hypothetical protein